MKRKITYWTLASILVLAASCVSCAHWEVVSTGPGWVRSINCTGPYQQHSTIVFEKENGEMTTLLLYNEKGPVPVWKGMHCIINYRVARGFCAGAEDHFASVRRLDTTSRD
jgi:hypothetical protein